MPENRQEIFWDAEGMKVIISHDVDHLYGRDHWFRDLIYPKLWVRSLLSAFSGKISWKECGLRIRSCFQRERNRILEVMDFDEAHGVPSTFFFGMNQALGMSYRPEEAREMIRKVHERGFAAGVHGVVYNDSEGIRKEYDSFVRTAGFEPAGIRMHYVRTEEGTFEKEAAAGYVFDSSEFDKEKCGTVKAPYRVGKMWEFPLALMDVYLTEDREAAREETVRRLAECRKAGLSYVTVLFHDPHFDEAYRAYRDWYVWFIESIAASAQDSFVSFEDAVRELESAK